MHDEGRSKISRKQVTFFRVKQFLGTAHPGTTGHPINLFHEKFPLLKDMEDLSHLKVCLSSFLHPHTSFHAAAGFQLLCISSQKSKNEGKNKWREETQTQHLRFKNKPYKGIKEFKWGLKSLPQSIEIPIGGHPLCSSTPEFYYSEWPLGSRWRETGGEDAIFYFFRLWFVIDGRDCCWGQGSAWGLLSCWSVSSFWSMWSLLGSLL